MTEKINRATVALAGGTVFLLTGIYDTSDVFIKYIDWDTIALIFSMMVLVSITQKSNFFSYVGVRFAQAIKGSPIPLLIGTSLLVAIGSALLDNVTTVLIFVPIILHITRLLNLPSFPYLLLTIISSNIGGAATLIGDPPNIMIGQAVDHLGFLSFIVHLAPLAMLNLVIVIGLAVLVFRKEILVRQINPDTLMAIDANVYLRKTPLLYKSLIVLGATLLGFSLHTVLNVDITTVALSGAVLLLLWTDDEMDTEAVFSQVEWVTLFFFVGLFTIVGGLEEVGVIAWIAEGIMSYTNGALAETSIMILWTSGTLSGFVDNIPFVAAMIPVIEQFSGYGVEHLDPIWWSLALGACLGGNATLLGASANIVVAGLAEGAKQRIPFVRFMLYGVPSVVISLVLSTLYVYVRYL